MHITPPPECRDQICAETFSIRPAATRCRKLTEYYDRSRRRAETNVHTVWTSSILQRMEAELVKPCVAHILCKKKAWTQRFKRCATCSCDNRTTSLHKASLKSLQEMGSSQWSSTCMELSESGHTWTLATHELSSITDLRFYQKEYYYETIPRAKRVWKL